MCTLDYSRLAEHSKITAALLIINVTRPDPNYQSRAHKQFLEQWFIYGATINPLFAYISSPRPMSVSALQSKKKKDRFEHARHILESANGLLLLGIASSEQNGRKKDKIKIRSIDELLTLLNNLGQWQLVLR